MSLVIKISGLKAIAMSSVYPGFASLTRSLAEKTGTRFIEHKACRINSRTKYGGTYGRPSQSGLSG